MADSPPRRDPFTEDVLNRVLAEHFVISLVTHEWERVELILQVISEELERTLLRYSEGTGIEIWNVDEVVWEALARAPSPDTDPADVIRWYKDDYRPSSILWMEDLIPYINLKGKNPNPVKCRTRIRCLRDFCTRGSDDGGKTIIISDPDDYLPMELEKDVEQFRLPLPKIDIISKYLDQVLADTDVSADEETAQLLCSNAAGLTVQEAESAFRLIAARMKREKPPRSEMNKSDSKVVIDQKIQIINKSGVLEYYEPDETMKDVGGMDKLREWLTIKGPSFTDAQDPPKGILLLGVPGCGKSLMAKAIASEWGRPLLVLKASNVFDKYVGESEGKITRALAIAEAVAPCVIWVDEIEKMLGGMSGSGELDSGVTARVGGAILTWMSDKKSPVFVVATANRAENLPPEMLRAGRFDELFFIDLPSKEVREKILDIHAKKRFTPEVMGNLDLSHLADISDGYTGAELEQSIIDAKDYARFLGEAPSTELIAKMIVERVPLAATMAEELEHIRERWGKTGRAKPADSSSPVNLNKTAWSEVRKAETEARKRRHSRRIG